MIYTISYLSITLCFILYVVLRYIRIESYNMSHVK